MLPTETLEPNAVPQQPSVSQTFIEESIKLLDQSMIKISHCLDQLTDQQIWWRPQQPLNSIGNLMLHLAGNLRQWTVGGIGGRDDDRDRESEFSHREQIEKRELLKRLSDTVDQTKSLLTDLREPQLTETRRIQEFEVTVLGAITHTTSHFVGHTHQIVFITRLILGDRYRFHWSPAKHRGDVPI